MLWHPLKLWKRSALPQRIWVFLWIYYCLNWNTYESHYFKAVYELQYVLCVWLYGFICLNENEFMSVCRKTGREILPSWWVGYLEIPYQIVMVCDLVDVCRHTYVCRNISLSIDVKLHKCIFNFTYALLINIILNWYRIRHIKSSRFRVNFLGILQGCWIGPLESPNQTVMVYESCRIVFLLFCVKFGIP